MQWCVVTGDSRYVKSKKKKTLMDDAQHIEVHPFNRSLGLAGGPLYV